MGDSGDATIRRFDRDYGEHAGTPAVIYFRVQPSSPEEVTELLVWLLCDDAGLINDKIVIVRKPDVREPPLR